LPPKLAIFPGDREWKQTVKARRFAKEPAPLELDPEEFRRFGYGVIDRITELLKSLPSNPVAPNGKANLFGLETDFIRWISTDTQFRIDPILGLHCSADREITSNS
jgi:hypothetical protein